MSEHNLGRTLFADELNCTSNELAPSIPQQEASASAADGQCGGHCTEIIRQLRADLEEAQAKECELNQAILDLDASWAVMFEQAKTENNGADVSAHGNSVQQSGEIQLLTKEVEDMRQELAAAHAREERLRLSAVPGAVLAELDLVRAELAEQRNQVAILRDELAAATQREHETNQAIMDLDQSWVQLADDMRAKAVAETTKELQNEVQALRAHAASDRAAPSPGWRASTPSNLVPFGTKTADRQTPWSTQSTLTRRSGGHNTTNQQWLADDTIEVIRSMHELIVRQLKSPLETKATAQT